MSGLGTFDNPKIVVLDDNLYDTLIRPYLIGSEQFRLDRGEIDEDAFEQAKDANPPQTQEEFIALKNQYTKQEAPSSKQRTRSAAQVFAVPANGYNNTRVTNRELRTTQGYEKAYTLRAFKEQFLKDGKVSKGFRGRGPIGSGYRSQGGLGIEDSVRFQIAAGGASPENLEAYLDAINAGSPYAKIIYSGMVQPGLHPGYKVPIFSTSGEEIASTDQSTFRRLLIDDTTRSEDRFDAILIRVPRLNEPTNRGVAWPPGWYDNGVINPIFRGNTSVGRNSVKIEPGNWVVFTAFTIDEYAELRRLLIKWTSDARSQFAQGKLIDFATGGWTTVEDARKALEKVLNKLGKTSKSRPPKPDPIDHEALHRLRLENAQALLLTAMSDMTTVGGIRPVLRKAEDLSRLKNGTSRSDYPDKKLLQKIAPTSLNLYDGEPQSLVDILANPFGMREFLCATPAELALLQPKLQFYLDGAPVEFPDHTNGDMIRSLAEARVSNAQTIQNIFRSRGTTGTDVGIKDFNWFFEGKMEGDSTLKAGLTLYFGNSSELLNNDYLKFVFGPSSRGTKAAVREWRKSRNKDITDDPKSLAKLNSTIASRLNVLKDPKTNFYAAENPYSADLEQSKATGIKKDNQPPKLTAQVGWAVPQPALGQVSEGFITAVKKTQRIINLRMHQYQVEYGDQGQIQLKIDYIGGINEYLSQPDKSNIFNAGLDLGRLYSRKVFVKTGRRLGVTNKDRGGVFDIAGNFVEDQEGLLDVAGQPRLQQVVWPLGYIKKQLDDGTNTRFDGITKVQRVGLAAAGVLYEIKTLRLIKQAFTSTTPETNMSETDRRQLETLIGYIDAANAVMSEIRSIQSDLVYSSFITNLLNSGKLYYATVYTDLINGLGTGFKKQANVGSGVNRGQVTLGTNYNFASGLPQGWRVDVRGAASAAGVAQQAGRHKKAITHNSGKAIQGKTQDGSAYLDPTRPDLCPEPGVDDEYSVLYYMKLGDILDLVLGGLSNQPDAPNAEYILGSFYPHSFGIPNTKPKDVYSLADIPISMDYFGHWFLKNFTSKGDVPSMSFQRFLNKLLTDLVANLFNRVIRTSSDSAKIGFMSFGNTTIASPIRIPSGARRSPSQGRLIGQFELRNLSRNRSTSSWSDVNQREYYIMYLKQLNPSLKGNRSQDEARGIYHLVLGADRGLVKNFKFSQVDIPYLKEMQIEGENYAQAVFLPQNVDITMVGNTLFRNGQTLYVNADFGLGAAAQKLGIGGYYTVVRVENTLGLGKFETRLKCILVKTPRSS